MDLRPLYNAAGIADPIERAHALSALMSEHQALVTESAKYRRHAIAAARERGLTLEQIATALGVTPGRISQMSKGPAEAAPAARMDPPRVVVERALPTAPAVRGALSLFLAEAAGQGLHADRQMLYIGVEPASDGVAVCLQVEPGEDVLAREKLMFANGVPVRIATSYFRADLFGETRLAEPEFVRPSLQAALHDLGYRFGRATETLTARRATSFERDTLDLEPDEWVVQVLRASYSTEDTPVHVLETICAATRHVFPIGQVAGTDDF